MSEQRKSKTSPQRPLPAGHQQILVAGGIRCDHCHEAVPLLGYMVKAKRGGEPRLLCRGCLAKSE
jgi:hypothetical protein